jgi:hypothetical protein
MLKLIVFIFSSLSLGLFFFTLIILPNRVLTEQKTAALIWKKDLSIHQSLLKRIASVFMVIFLAPYIWTAPAILINLVVIISIILF